MLFDLVHVILDAEDSGACARWFARRHDLDRGRAVVRITPPPTRRSVPRDILRGLGKRLTLPESPSQPADLRARAEIWLHAEQIHDLFVLRAHLLDDETLYELLDTCDQAVVTPWLIIAGDEPPAAMMALLKQVLVDPIGGTRDATYVRSFKQAAADEQLQPVRRTPPRHATWPELPDDEFWTFRSACDELLGDADFARVDAELLTGRMAGLEWIERRTRQPKWALRPFDATEIHGLLAGVYASATSTGQALARLRGVQTALFLAGVLVYIPADAITAIAATKPAPLDQHAGALLRSFASPRLAAAAVVALATGQPASELRTLNVQDIAHGGAEIILAGRAYPIPYYARGTLRAHLIVRAEDRAAAATRPLFRDPTDKSKRISVATLGGMLARVAAATGLAPNMSLALSPPADPRWPLEDHATIDILEPVPAR
ncbi:MAG: hypothetical protein ACR2KV_13455 [Solirubrobacteraceae bacterium]